MSGKAYFSNELFRFLTDLRKNNNRDWFSANKARYEAAVREPFLQFIADFSYRLDKISPYFVADPRPNGGSLFRIYRDVRFSSDKSPYKTHASAYFPHREANKDVQSPGFYLHLEPGASFAGGGLWHPDAVSLRNIRTAIVEQPKSWQQVHKSKLKVEGERLSRPPKGFTADHPFIEDIKLKDFVNTVKFTNAQVCGKDFMSEFLAACKMMTPLIKFLTTTLNLNW
ncbi:MAG: TIGR02453 family protein [Acidobacteriota bacterium]